MRVLDDLGEPVKLLTESELLNAVGDLVSQYTEYEIARSCQQHAAHADQCIAEAQKNADAAYRGGYREGLKAALSIVMAHGNPTSSAISKMIEECK